MPPARLEVRPEVPPRRSPGPAKVRDVIVGMELHGEIVSVGVLQVERSVSAAVDRSTGRFRYAAGYLRRANAVALDPVSLPLKEGEFRFSKFGGLPSCIRDAAPDNWGRSLIQRYYLARGVEAPLGEVDYLLASPMDRVGNLHFATDFDKDGIPQWDKNALKPETVQGISVLKSCVVEVLKNSEATFATPYRKELDALLTGAGGARPKISLSAPGSLYLVKLANPVQDPSSNSRLEEASMRMARAVSIETAEVSSRSSAGMDFLVVKRFDCPQGARGARLQMVSAMSVLDADDRPYARQNWSYPAFARELDRWSVDPATDKLQLFRAMVLRAMLSDADDHPRNYALIRDPDSDANRSGGSTLGQWRLSPLYDCVVGCGKGGRASELAMTIGSFGYEISERNILSEASAFGLTQAQARAEMKRIEAAVITEFPQILADCQVDEAGLAIARRSVALLDERPNENAIDQLMARVNGGAHAEKNAMPSSPAEEAAAGLLQEAGVLPSGSDGELAAEEPSEQPQASRQRFSV